MPSRAARPVREAARSSLGAALLALALAAHPARGAQPSAEPLPWQDAAPLALPFLQLPFESPATVPEGQLQLGVRTNYSSSIARDRRRELQVDYRLEVAQPTAVVRFGVGGGVELHAELPGVAGQSGFLEPVIKRIEGWAHSGNDLRRTPASGQPRLRIARPGGGEILIRGSDGALGDAWIGAKGPLLGRVGPAALAWRAALKLPTGRFPYGSGVAEAGGGLLASADLSHTHLWLASDLMVPDGPMSALRLSTRPHPSFQLAVGQDLGRRATLLLQASAHGSALAPVHLPDVDGWTFYVLAGVRVAQSRSFSFGAGLVENVLMAQRGTDIAAVFDLAWRP